MGEIDRRQRGAPVHRGQPAGVAVGQHVDRAGAPAALPRRLDQPQPMAADGAAGRDVVLADGRRLLVGQRRPVVTPRAGEGGTHLVQRPGEVHRRRPGRREHRARMIERGVGAVFTEREAHPIGRGGADQRRAADLHGLDRPRRVFQRSQAYRVETVGQQGLIDNLHRAPVRRHPDGAEMPIADLHLPSRPRRCTGCGPRSRGPRCACGRRGRGARPRMPSPPPCRRPRG